jgi:hypothetical protein
MAGDRRLSRCDAPGFRRGLRASTGPTAQATAARRDVLDADLREAESQLRLIPSVLVTDPQVDTASRQLSWMSFGLITVTSNDIQLARIAGMTLVPQLAGLVLMLAAAILQSRE